MTRSWLFDLEDVGWIKIDRTGSVRFIRVSLYSLKKQHLIIAFVSCIVFVIGNALWIGLFSFRTLGPKPSVLDLSDGTFNSVSWPRDFPSSLWTINRPGQIKILLPGNITITGNPLCVSLFRSPWGNGIIYYCKGRQQTDAFLQLKRLCAVFGIDSDPVLRWYHEGSSADNITQHVGNRSGAVEVGLVVLDILQSPNSYEIEVTFAWPAHRAKEETSSPENRAIDLVIDGDDRSSP